MLHSTTALFMLLFPSLLYGVGSIWLTIHFHHRWRTVIVSAFFLYSAIIGAHFWPTPSQNWPISIFFFSMLFLFFLCALAVIRFALYRKAL